MIRIICGTYGHRTGSRITPVTPDDQPITLAPEEEQRLVNKGVAVYVEPLPVLDEPPVPEMEETMVPGLEDEADDPIKRANKRGHR